MSTNRGVYHVVKKTHNGLHPSYHIFLNNEPFLDSRMFGGSKLRRHQAYAIVNLLNSERRATKWSEKFRLDY
jgi:hypothetical protein